MNEQIPHFYEFDSFQLDTTKKLLVHNGEPVSLMPKAFDVLLLLLHNHGQVVTKDDLMAGVWHDSIVEENSLNVNISALRRIFGEKPRDHRFIVTVPGIGYKFVAQVNEISNGSNPANLVIPASEKSASEWNLTMPSLIQPRLRKIDRKWLILIASLVLITVITFLYWFAKNRDQFNQVPQITKTLQITSWSGLDCFPSISSDGNSIAFSSDRMGTFEIYVKQLVEGAREVELTTDGGQNFEPAFSPNGSQIAFYSKKRGGIWVIPVSGGTAKQITEFGSHPAWSPDGTQIAFQGDSLAGLDFNTANAQPPSTIWVVSAKGEDEPKQITQVGNPAGGHGAPNWSPDGKRIVFDSSYFGNYSVWSVSIQGTDIKQISDNTENSTDSFYAPDGKSIYFITDRGTSIKKMNINQNDELIGKPIKVLDANGSRIRQVSVAGDGKRLVYSSLSTSSDIWTTNAIPNFNLQKNELVQLTQGKNTRNTIPIYSPNGKKIVYATYTVGSKFGLWLMDADGENKFQLNADGSSPSWFPDGKRIAFFSDRDNQEGYYSLDIETKKETKLFDFQVSAVRPRLSPDAKQVVYSLAQSGTAVWLRGIDGNNPSKITSDNIVAGYPAWSPDGKWIAIELKRGEYSHVAVIPSEGGEPVQLTFEKGLSWISDWSPDSEKVIFAGQRNDIWNIYSVSHTDKEIKQLTNFTKFNSYVRYPVWSPVNNKIAFEYAETTGNIWMIELK